MELYNQIIKTYCAPAKKEGEFYKNKIEEYFEGKFKKLLFIKGENIINENDNNSCIYFIERGKVVLTRKNRGGKEYCNGYLLAGEFFGFSSFSGMTENFNYRALTNCNVYEINSEAVKAVIESNPLLKDHFSDILIDSIRSITLRQGNLIMGGCRDSFVRFISEHIKDFGRLDEYNNILLYLDVNLAEISVILNMTRETLSRIVSDMKKEGIIETKRRFIKILDMERFIA